MKRPQNCGTGYCSCIECVMEPAQEPAPLRDVMVANLVREGINKHRARELADHFVGLTNAQQEPEWYHFVKHGEDCFVPYRGQAPENATPLYTSPPAQPTVPDALTAADKESPEYTDGWNDCRQAMLAS